VGGGGARIWFCKLQLVVLSGVLLSPPPPKKISLSFFHILLESGHEVAIGWWRILFKKDFLSFFIFFGKTSILQGGFQSRCAS
jgi:hypothetical protein